ncbi:hypothetical protein [Lysobacter xanthus]
MMKTMVVALLLVTGSAWAQSGTVAADAPAAAPAVAAAPATAAAPAAAGEDKKVCKLERELGSNRAKRVCRTRAEVNADADAARASLQDAQRGH